MEIAGQVCPTQDNTSSWLIDTECDPALLSNELKSTPGFDLSLSVDTLRDEQLSPSWCMINSAARGSASYSIRSRPDPYGGLTHLTILFSILTSVASPSAVHGPVARCLTVTCSDKAKTCPCRIPSLSWHSHSQHQSAVQHPSFHTWLCPALRNHSYTPHLLMAL